MKYIKGSKDKDEKIKDYERCPTFKIKLQIKSTAEELTTDGLFLAAHFLKLDIDLSLKIQKRSR